MLSIYFKLEQVLISIKKKSLVLSQISDHSRQSLSVMCSSDSQLALLKNIIGTLGHVEKILPKLITAKAKYIYLPIKC
jgi:hypothetical protein